MSLGKGSTHASCSLGRGPNSLALVKKVSLTKRGHGGYLGDDISPVPTPRRLGKSPSPLLFRLAAFGKPPSCLLRPRISPAVLLGFS